MKWSKSLLVLIVLLSVVWLQQHLMLVGNVTESLPQKIWLGIKGFKPKKGDYVVLVTNNYPISITKQIVGVENDTVILKGRDFYINGIFVARAKTHSKQGEPLIPSKTGVLGKDEYFVASSHPDSFDSRYQPIGWVNEKQIIAVAYPLW